MREVMAVVLVALATGCAVVRPAAWSEREETAERVKPTPWVMYGASPLSWDFEDGSKVALERNGAALHLVPTGARAASLACSLQPNGPSVPETRFGCWDEAAQLTFWVAPNKACTNDWLHRPQTVLRFECFEGEARVGDERVFLETSRMPSTGVAMNDVAWVGVDGRLLLAVTLGAVIQLHRPKVLGALTPELESRLVALTIAYHYFKETEAARR